MQAIKATQRSVTALCSQMTNVGDSVFSPVSSLLPSKSSNSETVAWNSLYPPTCTSVSEACLLFLAVYVGY